MTRSSNTAASIGPRQVPISPHRWGPARKVSERKRASRPTQQLPIDSSRRQIGRPLHSTQGGLIPRWAVVNEVTPEAGRTALRNSSPNLTKDELMLPREMGVMYSYIPYALNDRLVEYSTWLGSISMASPSPA